MTPTFGSLFSGIGGMDLGIERAGWECRYQVENDPYCQRVLAKHWPNVKRYGDIREVTGYELEPVDLLCGGFPCQPVSLAGKRQGQADSRWLWPEFARLLGVLRPRFVLVENVPGLLIRVFGDVLTDLARLGYDAEWESLPASAFGAPHLRYRVFIVAYTPKSRCQTWRSDDLRVITKPVQGSSACPHTQDVADDSQHGRREGRQRRFDPSREGKPEQPLQALADANSTRLSQREIIGCPTRPIERSDWWDVEPTVGRVAHGISHRVDRLRGLGNAVVPQIAEWVGQQIIKEMP